VRYAIVGFTLSAALLFGYPSTTEASEIYVLNAGVQGAIGVVTAISDLTSLGHSITTGGTLADYTAYDQVWDLRYNANFVAADISAFSSFLGAGGRVYLTGENPAFDAQRNLSLSILLSGVGAGSLIYSSQVASNTQAFTTEGAALNTPNAFSSLAFLGARSVSGPGNGFFVTESAPGIGSMVAWDFGDIAGAPDARMIALWDIDVFRTTTGNGMDWTENMVTYLDGSPSSGTPAPEPSSLVLLVTSILVAGFVGRSSATRARTR
jgi:hypothetical protein